VDYSGKYELPQAVLAHLPIGKDSVGARAGGNCAGFALLVRLRLGRRNAAGESGKGFVKEYTCGFPGMKLSQLL